MISFKEYAKKQIEAVEKLEVCFDRKYDFLVKRLKDKEEEYCSDLWTCCYMGFLTKEEVKYEMENASDFVSEVIIDAHNRFEEKVGEIEALIIYLMHKDRCTREEAIKKIEEWDVY